LGCVKFRHLVFALSVYLFLSTLFNYTLLGAYYALTNFILGAFFLVTFSISLFIVEELGW